MTIVEVAYPAPAAMTPRAESQIDTWIVHHTAGLKDQTPLQIDAEHRAIGDSMIAYNYVIAQNGTIYAGRPAGYVPAAAYGRNAQSLDVVLVGQFQPGVEGYTGPPTPMQMTSLEQLTLFVHRKWPAITRTIGHRDVAGIWFPGDEADYATLCPGDDCYALLPAMRSRVAAALVAGK